MLGLSKRAGHVFFAKARSLLPCSRRLSITHKGRSIDKEDLFKYSNGRFLINEESQRQKRYVRFDVDHLCELVGSLGKTISPVIAIEKMEGGFSKALLMKRADGVELIAKISCPNAGPAHYTTAAEVAVLDYGKCNFFAWASNSANPIGSEYIVMEKASGTQLFKIWGDLDGDERLSIIRQLVEIEGQLAAVHFPAFGYLYHTDPVQSNSFYEKLNSSLDPMSTFCIGPSCDRAWQSLIKHTSSTTKVNGPWRTLSEYGLALISREKHRIRTETPITKPAFPTITVDEQIATLERAAKVMELLHTVPHLRDFGIPLLWHTDLHMGNIYVSQEGPKEIVSIIDWQSLGVGPAFLQSRWPIFLEPPENYVLGLVHPKLPDNFDKLDETDKEIEKYKLKKAHTTKAYETATFLWDRLAHDARSVHGLFKELFIRCEDAFEDGIIPLRECLIDISRAWSDLGFTGRPAIHFSQQEIQSHRTAYERCQEWHRIQQFARSYLDTDADGWISPELDFDEKVRQNRELFELFLEQMANGRTREELMQIWPFSEAL